MLSPFATVLPRTLCRGEGCAGFHSRFVKQCSTGMVFSLCEACIATLIREGAGGDSWDIEEPPLPPSSPPPGGNFGDPLDYPAQGGLYERQAIMCRMGAQAVMGRPKDYPWQPGEKADYDAMANAFETEIQRCNALDAQAIKDATRARRWWVLCRATLSGRISRMDHAFAGALEPEAALVRDAVGYRVVCGAAAKPRVGGAGRGHGLSHGAAGTPGSLAARISQCLEKRRTTLASHAGHVRRGGAGGNDPDVDQPVR